MKTKLPIGVQTLDKIINGDYIYVDKSKIAYDLIEDFSYVFLSRPRRFGKSLFLDTLKNIFEGNKKLFKGLYIENKWNWKIKYPVIVIRFDGDLRNPNGVKAKIKGLLKNNYETLGIEYSESFEGYNYSNSFEDLIQKTSKKYGERVVILIDEYDKPILDNLDQIEVAIENREILRSFYSIIKGNDEFVKFSFLTGVTKFSKASIFSGLNMLEDISLNPKYGNICGITQIELEENFTNYLKGQDKEKIKDWYNGYNFLGDPVYNPFDVLKFFANDYKFSNYWFSSGTPAFLIKLLEKEKYFLPKISNLKVGEMLLDSFDIRDINLEVLLFQSGYLTIDKQVISARETIEYKLKIPNREVKTSLSDFIIRFFVQEIKSEIQDNLYSNLNSGDLEGFIKELNYLFSSIPYNNYTKNLISNYEGYYASIIFVYLQSLGYEIVGEDVTNKGRIDLTVKTKDKIYILEFKMDSFKEIPLKQIEEKKYYEKYLNETKKIFLVGVVFSHKNRNVLESEWKEI